MVPLSHINNQHFQSFLFLRKYEMCSKDLHNMFEKVPSLGRAIIFLLYLCESWNGNFDMGHPVELYIFLYNAV